MTFYLNLPSYVVYIFSLSKSSPSIIRSMTDSHQLSPLLICYVGIYYTTEPTGILWGALSGRRQTSRTADLAMYPHSPWSLVTILHNMKKYFKVYLIINSSTMQQLFFSDMAPEWSNVRPTQLSPHKIFFPIFNFFINSLVFGRRVKINNTLQSSLL